MELFLLELNHFSNALNTSLAVDNFLLPGHQAQSFCHLNIGALGTACNALTCQFFGGFGRAIGTWRCSISCRGSEH